VTVCNESVIFAPREEWYNLQVGTAPLVVRQKKADQVPSGARVISGCSEAPQASSVAASKPPSRSTRRIPALTTVLEGWLGGTASLGVLTGLGGRGREPDRVPAPGVASSGMERRSVGDGGIVPGESARKNQKY
jgi:hypothetical protein